FGRQGAGSAKMGQRFIGGSGIMQGTAETHLDVGVVRTLLLRLSQELDGLGAVSAHQAGHAVQDLRIHQCWRIGKHLLQSSLGRIGLPLVEGSAGLGQQLTNGRRRGDALRWHGGYRTEESAGLWQSRILSRKYPLNVL